ncbi:small oligopeptide transporter [Dentipellis sp. KUC8613]|nr:small oligopeptide transporter [Dentipellis sp. KUC8613]
MSANAEGHIRDSGIYDYSLRNAEKSSENGFSHSTIRPVSMQEPPPISSAPEFFDPNLDFSDTGLEDDSPYPEVRAAVANFDDPSMPVSTIRAWVIGLFWAILLPGINQFFHFRYPSILVSGLVAQLVAFPMGRLWARVMPRFAIFGVSINPGPFTIKEHVLVTVMAGVGAQAAYATDIIAVQRVYYQQNFNFIYQWMLVMSTQFIGFSIGGIARRFLVAPPSMIWPSTLVQCALFNTLHSQNYSGTGLRESMSRERFFLLAFIGSTVWYIVPGYLFQALSVFTWACWIAPKNVIVNQLFGYRSGMGFSLLTFDWNQIAYVGSPLATPWWAEANVFASFVFFYWFLTPLLYASYTNTWYGAYMPISSRNAFDNTGKSYDLGRVLNADATLNSTAYQEYSPLFLSTTFAVSYGLSFASMTATIVHSLIYFWKPIKLHFGRSLREQPDVHAQLMSRYPQVSEWWYACIFAVTFTFAGLCIKLWPTSMTIWALLVALLIALIYIIPIGMLQAITNRQVGLNVIGELVAGLILPGKPVAMMMFKTWTYITMSQAMIFTSDFKLGHYMKVPPRPMFWAQILSTAIAGTVQLGVQTWMFSNIDGLCEAGQKNHFVCANIEVFGTASIVWGVVGPMRQFAKGQIYYGLSYRSRLSMGIIDQDDFCLALVFFFLIGALCPMLLWWLTRKYPQSWLNYVNFPLIFAGLGTLPPANASNFVPWAILGFIFQYFIRRRFFPFWAKYNYVLSAALDAGTAVGVILVYFCLQYPANGEIGAKTIQVWWGNTVFENNADWKSLPLKTVEDGHPFGPRTWS